MFKVRHYWTGNAKLSLHEETGWETVEEACIEAATWLGAGYSVEIVPV